MKRLPAAAAALALSACALSAQTTAVPPEEATANLERALKAAPTLRADFEQLHYSMSVSEPLREKGELLFEKPDRMRWEYRSPQPKVFIYKEGVLESYLPEEKQLTRSPVAEEALKSDIFGIFLGTMSFAEAYAVESNPFPTDAARVRQVKLTPRTEGDFSHILLEIDETTWLPRRVVFLEWAGAKREFIFSRVRTGVRLPAGAFTLKVPPGTEVIDDTATVIRDGGQNL
ncbi:MAG TPA: outer membrane lipoprotein carrier protein LolA [Candidatus Aminicenantes bacterium]|nr:outer membrane lipoprotein carrier protein LolA [Candidatus Aminicenantes bacterium]